MKKKRSGNIKKILIILLMLCACAAAVVYILGDHESKDQGQSPEQPSEKTAAEDAAPEEYTSPEAVIFTVSDYQEDPNFDPPRDTLRGLLEAVSDAGVSPDAAIICGDYTNDEVLHDYQLSPEDAIEEIRGILSEEAPSVRDGNTIFVQGNHDKLTESISESGLHEYGSYLVYVLNTENDFPWKQGKVSGCLVKVRAAAAEMKDCFDKLIAEGETRPVIIAGHVPLQFTSKTSSRFTTGDNLYSSLIFDVVNEAAKDLDIIYLFGHNHSKGWDCYLGGGCVYKAPGDSMLLPVFIDSDVNSNVFEEKTLNFTYMNAGYTGFYMNCAPEEYSDDPDSPYRAADETLTCSVIEVYGDRIVITRFDEDGPHDLGAAGEGSPFRGGLDDGLIDPKYYSKAYEGPAVIERKIPAEPEQEELQDAA